MKFKYKLPQYADGDAIPEDTPSKIYYISGKPHYRKSFKTENGGVEYTYVPVQKPTIPLARNANQVISPEEKERIKVEQAYLANLYKDRKYDMNGNVVKPSPIVNSTPRSYEDVNIESKGIDNLFNFSSYYMDVKPITDDVSMDNLSNYFINKQSAPNTSSTPGAEPMEFTPEQLALNDPKKYEEINLKSKGISGIDYSLGTNEVEPVDVNTKKPTEMQLSNLFTNPMYGQSTDLSSELFTAGQSLAYDPSFLNNAEGEKRAKGANLLRGIGAAGAASFGIARGLLSGAGYQKKMQQILADYYAKQKKAQTENYQYAEDGGFFQDGGMVRMPFEKQSTNEYISGLPEAMEDLANAEIEVDEYVKHPDGVVQKVWGNTHEDEGEKVILDEGTMVISNNLKLTKEQAKSCSDAFDMKITTSDTYARVIDKFSKKIGLTEKTEELEKLFKQVKKQEQLADDSTRKLNLNFLFDEIQELEIERANLLKQRSDFTSYIFNKQEESKELPKFKDGGLFGDSLDALCKKHGLTRAQGEKLIEQMKYDDGGLTTYKGKKNASKYSDADLLTMAQYLGFDPKKGNKAFQEFLYANPKYKALIEKSHSPTEGLGPNSAGVYNEGYIGARYDFVLDQIKTDMESKPAEDKTTTVEDFTLNTAQKRKVFPIMPDQTNLPPESLTSHTKIETNFDRLDPVAIGFEDQLREISRVSSMSNEQIAMNPTAQQAALTAATDANMFDTVSKVVGETTRFNASQVASTNEKNLQASMAEELQRGKNIADFEERQFKALANTQNDYYNYFSANQRNNINKFNYLTKFNIAQDLFENVSVDPFGNPEIDPATGIPLTMYSKSKI